MLSLQPLKLKPLQQITKHCEADLLHTPYLMLSKECEQSVSFSEQKDSLQEGEVKKHKIAEDREILSTAPYPANFPSVDSEYPLIN